MPSGASREALLLRRRAPRGAMLVALVILLAVSALSLRSLRPPAPVPASAPDSVFSAGRAWRHVERIAVAPRPVGSAAHDAVRAYLSEQLASMGVEPRIEVSSRSVRGRGGSEREIVLHNIVAVLRGTDATGAVALMSHYDSHRRAPGAGDDGLGVAAVLEAARALRARGPLRNDLVLLFTDGEELGLLGALEFVEADPAAADVRVVLNFEGRGSHGPALMFETGPGNAALVRTFHRADPHPIGSSLFPEAYRYLPNDTDFSVFLASGIRGLNFAHIGRAQTYHQASDVPANASPATLQHHGEHAVAMARAFGTLDLRALPGPDSRDAVFFNAPGLGLVRYSAGFALPHAIGVLVLWIGAVVLGRRRRVVRLRGVVVGFALSLLALIVCTAAAWAAGWVAGMEAEAGSLTGKLVEHETPYLVALVAVSMVIVLWPLLGLARRLGAAGLLLGVLLTLALLGTAAAVVAPGASYLLLWPAAFSIAAAYVCARPTLTARDVVFVTILLVPAAALWAPHLSLFFTGLTLNLAPALGIVTALAAMTLAPLVALSARSLSTALPVDSGPRSGYLREGQ